MEHIWVADVQRQENQEDHVLVFKHCHVSRDEARVIGVGEANVRALEDDGTYAEGGSRPLTNGVVETAVGQVVGPRLRLVRGHRLRYNGRAEHEGIVLASGASCCVARNQNNSARQLLDSGFDLCVVIDEPAVRAIEP